MLNKIEGLGVDIHQARFTGTFDVTEEDDDSLGLDSVVILLVAARSGQIQHTIRDSGDVVAKRVLKVSDAVPLTGEAREEAIRRMTSHQDTNQGSFDWGMSPGALEAGVTNRHLSDSSTSNDEPDAMEEHEVERIAPSTTPSSRGPSPAPGRGEPDIFVPTHSHVDVEEVEVVGQIRKDRKDVQLNKFLRESYQ